MASRRWLVIGGAVVMAVALGGVAFALGAPTTGDTPVTAVPSAAARQALLERGGEGPSEPQVPTVVVIHPGKKKKFVMSNLPGYTVYTFSADTKHKSKCKGECARRWRPVVSAAGKPQAGAGVALPEIGSVLRDDGAFQVTFNDLPVYYFEGDTKPGDEEGTDLDEYGGKWNPEPPRGKKPK
jgi:predicted lipoprotein with Yx(FWY)xxD motif